ncbi:pirin family protein [Tautonia marina]|uniref:pirin family protein n=1 Tax=Tautonia marina TaxID=2653855 RepID=UPI001260ADAF|nr:pirin family protein [Tautonia marina]
MKRLRRILRNIPQHWVGDGFPVRSLFSYGGGNAFDPFLLLDYAGPHPFEPASAPRGVEEHPHRGFETVTIVYQGELAHRDSSGSHGTIGAGDVQWMTAASGVVHEEFHSERFTRDGGTLEMVQLWVNLPARDKRAAPGYQSLLDADIPRVSLADGSGTVRVIAGEFQETPGAARTFTPINVWDIQLDASRSVELPLPEGHTSLIVVQSGSVQLDGTRVSAVEVADLTREGHLVSLLAESPTRLLVLTGEPIGEPIAGHGPFVMNTPDEIQQAIQDYREGRLGRLS